jgi:hypothetical protein
MPPLPTVDVMTAPEDSELLPTPDGALAQRIVQVAGELQATLTPLLEQLAGSPPRPVRLTRASPGPGLDKSLASRLVQAAKAESDMQFLHLVPSPTGLRMLLDRAHEFADAALIQRTAAAIERFQSLLDALPGGRQALDAHMGESQASIREKREHIARQASFKAVSFLFGHYCETLATAIFVFPSKTPGQVDILEVHRRIGLRRLTPSAQLPLLSVFAGREPAEGEAPQPPSAEDLAAPAMADVTGNPHAHDPADFLVAAASSDPLPALQVEHEGAIATFLLAAGGVDMTPLRLTTAFRVLRAETLVQSVAYRVLRNYMLHTPCRTLVRDVYLADGLWPDAFPQVGYYLPSPSGMPAVDLDPGEPHYRRVNLTTRIEQRPHGAEGFALAGVADQRTTLEAVLARAGIDPRGFRGWRCEMAYPVPLIEMKLAFRFASAVG